MTGAGWAVVAFGAVIAGAVVSHWRNEARTGKRARYDRPNSSDSSTFWIWNDSGPSHDHGGGSHHGGSDGGSSSDSGGGDGGGGGGGD